MFYRTSYLAQMNLRQPHPKKTKQNTHIFVFVTQFVLCLQNGSERQQCGHGTSEGVLCCIMIGCWQQMFWAQWIRLALGYLCVLNRPPECLSQVTINTIAMVFWIHNAIICCLSLKPAYTESMNTLLVTVGLFLFCTLNVGTLNLNCHHQKLV